MRNVWHLTKIHFQGFIARITKTFNSKRRSTLAAVIFMIFFSLLMIVTFISNSFLTMNECLALEKGENPVENAHQLAMFINSSFAILLLLFVTLFRCVSPNRARDDELLLSLPIKKSEIISARNVYNYIFDLSCFIVALLPSFIVYYIYAPTATIWILISGLLLIILLPLLSNGIGGILGVLFGTIARKMKHYSLFQTIFSLALIILYLVVNFWTQSIVSNISGTVEEIKNGFFITKYLMEFILDGNLFVLLFLIIISVGLYVISIIISAKRLGKIQLTNSYKNEKIIYKKDNIMGSLIKKELKQYFNSTTYLINSCFSGIIYFGFAVASLVLGVTKGFAFLQFIPGVSTETMLLIIFTLLASSFVITGSSISFEGKKIWILKGNPISELTIFKAKILTNLFLTTIIIVVSFPFMLSFLTWTNFWLFLIIPFTASLFSITLGLIINLKFPKINWEREDEVIKQSMASFLSFILPIPIMGFGFAVYIAVLASFMPLYLFGIVLSLVLILLELFLIIWLKKRGTKLFREIS